MDVDQIIAAMNAGTLTAAQALDRLSTIIMAQSDDSYEVAYTRAAKYLAPRATDPAMAQKFVLSGQAVAAFAGGAGGGFTGSPPPGMARLVDEATEGVPDPGMPGGPPAVDWTNWTSPQPDPYQIFTPGQTPTTAEEAMRQGRAQGAGAFPGEPWTVGTGEVGGPISLEQARKEREDSARARENVFREFLATSPQFAGVNPLVQRSLRSFGEPAEQSYLLGNVDPSRTFFNFLSRGGGILSPTEGARRIGEIAGWGGGGAPMTPGQTNILGNLGAFDASGVGNQNIFQAALQTALPGVTAAFRPQFANQAQRIFDRFQGADPRASFLQYLGERGGNIFGAPGSSGSPFAAFGV
jgi:hypothetical protein